MNSRMDVVVFHYGLFPLLTQFIDTSVFLLWEVNNPTEDGHISASLFNNILDSRHGCPIFPSTTLGIGALFRNFNNRHLKHFDYFAVIFLKTILKKKHLKAWYGDRDQTKHLVLMTQPMGKPCMLGSSVSSHDGKWKGEGTDGLILGVKHTQFVKWVKPWTIINNNLSGNFPVKPEIQCLIIRTYFFQIPK